MKKCKKIFIILPMILTILLSMAAPLCSFAATYTIDNTLINYFLALGSHSDILSFEEYSSFDTLSSGFSGSYIYIRGVSCEPTYQSVKCESFFFKADDASYSVEDDGTYCFSFSSTPLCNRYEKTFYFNSSGSYYNFGSSSSDGFLSYSLDTICYNPDTNIVSFYRSSSLVHSFEFYSGLYEIFDTNVVDLDTLDVTVTFKPDLNGNVDRTVTDSNGNEGLGQVFSMHITNNSRKAIQYSMDISAEGATVYRYITNEWVYAFDISNYVSSYRGLPTSSDSYSPVLVNMPSTVHYLLPDVSSTQIFKWSQINLKEDVVYTITVKAVFTDLDFASIIQFGGNNSSYVFSIDDYETVYSSTFSIDYLGDVTYNPDDKTNGVIPNNSDSDVNALLESRNAIIDDDGSVVYDNYDAYNDPNSHYNTFGSAAGYDNVIDGDGNYYRFIPSDISDFGTGFSNFGGMIASVFSILPSGFYNLFMFGLFALILIGIIKAVK